VKQLKRAVAKEGSFKLGVEEMRLIFLGKILADESATLEATGVKAGTVLILAPKLKAAPKPKPVLREALLHLIRGTSTRTPNVQYIYCVCMVILYICTRSSCGSSSSTCTKGYTIPYTMLYILYPFVHATEQHPTIILVCFVW
jgi:hypothetical protein